jgi:hypothetical protein
VLWVDFIWLVANFGTFLLRFAIFHYVLFSDRPAAHRRPAAGPDTPPPDAHPVPRHAAAPARPAARHAAAHGAKAA